MKVENENGRSPAFQFYPDKWASHTGHLSDAAYRIYHKMLCWMWLQSPDYTSIPAKPEKIARLLAEPCERIASALREIQDEDMPLLKVEGDRLVSSGLRKEADKQAIRSRTASAASQTRWAKYKLARTQPESNANGMQTHSDSIADGMPEASPPSPSPSPSPDPQLENPAAPAAVAVPKRWADEIKAVTDHYHTHRPKSKQTADSKIKARLEEGFTVEDIKSAIDGYFNSEFHNGANDRGKKFLNLELMVRDAKHIEDGKELLTAKPFLAKPVSQTPFSNPKAWEGYI